MAIMLMLQKQLAAEAADMLCLCTAKCCMFMHDHVQVRDQIAATFHLQLLSPAAEAAPNATMCA